MAGEAAASARGQYVTSSIEGLRPETTYHYRLIDTNSGGKGEGEDQTFTTTATQEPGSGPLPPGFSLTGTAPTAPAGAMFPNLTGLAPTPPAAPKGSTSAPLTRAQKRSKALNACKKDKRKAKRAKCETEARRKYGIRARRRK